MSDVAIKNVADKTRQQDKSASSHFPGTMLREPLIVSRFSVAFYRAQPASVSNLVKTAPDPGASLGALGNKSNGSIRVKASAVQGSIAPNSTRRPLRAPNKKKALALSKRDKMLMIASLIKKYSRGPVNLQTAKQVIEEFKLKNSDWHADMATVQEGVRLGITSLSAWKQGDWWMRVYRTREFTEMMADLELFLNPAPPDTEHTGSTPA
jgi:hypothetical protein